MKNTFWIIIFILFNASIVKTESSQIRVVSTANVHGETDPCG